MDPARERNVGLVPAQVLERDRRNRAPVRARRRVAPGQDEPIEREEGDRQGQHPDDEGVERAAAARSATVDVFVALDPLRRHLERPCQEEREWEAEGEHQ